MKSFYYFVAITLFATACTIEKTDYDSELIVEVPNQEKFEEILQTNQSGYTISIESNNGKLYKGYNAIRVKIQNTNTLEEVTNAQVTVLPLLKTSDGSAIGTCPATNQLSYLAKEKHYEGHIIFTQENKDHQWDLLLQIIIGEQEINYQSSVKVAFQPNKNLNMTTFVGYDEVEYIIALAAPSAPRVAENELVACIYKKNASVVIDGENQEELLNVFTTADNFILHLDPRMPEPSMGNHSSPNNKDLIQAQDKRYYGTVNYTMTGNWTLNFILENHQGRIIKGTKVPTDFTPGVEGVKSELYIDILF